MIVLKQVSGGDVIINENEIVAMYLRYGCKGDTVIHLTSGLSFRVEELLFDVLGLINSKDKV